MDMVHLCDMIGEFFCASVLVWPFDSIYTQGYVQSTRRPLFIDVIVK